MTLLASHLEQISASAKTIADLEFPPPKRFTNALLNNPEITTLIRDTEPHERALFSLDPNAVRRNGQQTNNFENGMHSRKSGFPTGHPMRHSAVSRVLGNDLLQEIRQSSNARSHGGVNVEILLRGAEKLCEVYSIPGAHEKIRALRNRHKEVAASISILEEKVSKQQSVLERKNSTLNSEDSNREDDPEQEALHRGNQYTEEDLQLEEDEIRELEARRKALEDRVSGMERDLGGLLK
ncbi:hypothetical protein H2200_011894 [Cladophialophora chaetospira]|uniref:DASH complex subunit SPC34 n=1 Tax=Cladophialophora chaetospira TaxID=386627 RepID=A0AA38WYZ2_9EURO|nr:hypothetical protein H2200_011894 [Cladophialophora chaetospira]